MRVTDAISGWLSYIERHCSKTTYKSYKSVLWRFSDDMPEILKHITAEHVERWLDGLPTSNATINRYACILSSFFGYCEEHYGVKNPIKYKRLPTPPPKQRVITEEELNKLLAVATPAQRCVLLLMAHTGLRCSELRNLKPGDVCDGFLAVASKGRARRIPLNQTARNQVNPILFNYTKSKLRSPNSLWRVLERLSKQVGIPRANPHSLRHFFATRLIGKIDIYRLSKLLGHKSTTTTETIYLHFIAERDLAGALDVLDKPTEED